MRSVAEIFRSYAATDATGRHVGGTDKETNHRYGEAYERLFPHRLNVKWMMEVGVTDGSSILAWREVFPNAMCVGMDIHPAYRIQHATPEDRVEFHIGDMSNLNDCRRVAQGRQFDFICEDATHNLGDSLRCLLYLWPFVRPGGMYVIEEFANVGELRDGIEALWSNSVIIDTQGPFGGNEPLVVLHKPMRLRG